MNMEERLKRLFIALPEQIQAIDDILESGVQKKTMVTSGPLLMRMSDSAKLLGVSRATLWRMIKSGILQKIEILPGSFRLRRADLEAIAAGHKTVAPQNADSDLPTES
jgi:excisionase family DNA binding protein